MNSRHRSLLAVLVLSGFAWPATATDLERLSASIALDSWSVIDVDYRSGHHYSPYGHRRYYGRPYYRGGYHRPYRYWMPPRHYGHYRYYSPRYGHWDRRDDRRWRDEHRRDDRRWRDDRRRDDRRWRDGDRDDRRHDGGRDRRGD